ncbi:hypothetical protein FPOAC2_14148 [Fusarium poae]
MSRLTKCEAKVNHPVSKIVLEFQVVEHRAPASEVWRKACCPLGYAERIGSYGFVTEFFQSVLLFKVIIDAGRALTGKKRSIVMAATMAILAEPELIVPICGKLCAVPVDC